MDVPRGEPCLIGGQRRGYPARQCGLQQFGAGHVPTLEMMMKRLAMLSVIAGLVVGLPASHLVWSAPPGGKKAKTTLCHVAAGEGKTVVITVAPAAVNAHLRHGDCVLSEGQTCSFDDVNGIAVCTTPTTP